MDLSIVIPCLNESDTIEICINKIQNQINKLNLKAEIIVSDNGSTDNSAEISKNLGAKVISCNEKGYGSAVINGINNSKGDYILIADADDSYNFDDLELFYNKIKEGYDIVQGCRLPSGGGKIEKNAMPLSHKYIGNPLFTKMCKIFYSLPFNDVYCGMKIIKREFYKNANFFSKGMVFCLEILIKSKILNAKIAEIPITLFKDGRKNSKSHLKTISDGLKTLKFILITSPKWIYFIPSTFFLIVSLPFYFYLKNIYFLSNDEVLICFFSFILISFQLFMLGLFAAFRAKSLGLYQGKWLNKFFYFFNLRLVFVISAFFCILLLIKNFNNFIIISLQFDLILQVFSFYFIVCLVANSLMISLLSLNK